MQLPVIMPDLHDQRFDCGGCTNCCRDLVVHLTKSDREVIDRQGWHDKLQTEPYVRLGDGYVLNHHPEGGCVFLTTDGRCRIHADYGLANKPMACQLYPFTLQAEQDGLRVGLRFDCPTVAVNGGGPLSKHHQAVKRLARQLAEAMPAEFSAVTGQKWNITPDCAASSATIDRLNGLNDWGQDEQRPFSERLLGVYELAQSLREAILNRLDEPRRIELIKLLMSDIPRLARERLGVPVHPPTRRQCRLLRHAVFAHCEHITFHQATAGLFKSMLYRGSQMRRARRFVRGQGPIPRLGPLSGSGCFEKLEHLSADDCLDRDQCDHLLTRYLCSRISSRTIFGPGYYGWDVVSGLGALLLSMAVIGWLTRYSALREERTGGYRLEDLVSAVGWVDRAVGRAGELGGKSARLRVRYLWENQGLLRLLRTYAI